jgi:hypothetical protein
VQFLCIALGFSPGAAPAFDTVTLEAQSARLPDGHVARGLTATLGLSDPARPTLDVRVARFELAPGTLPLAISGPLNDLHVHCGRLVISEPHFACQQLQLSLQQDRFGTQSLSGAVEFRSAPVTLDVSLQGLALADGRVDLVAQVQAPRTQPADWQIHLDGRSLALERALALIAPWWSPPAGASIKGTATVGLTASGVGVQPGHAELTLAVDGVDAQNAASTVATEKLAARLTGAATQRADGIELTLELRSDHGEMLAGPVLLDLAARPLSVSMAGAWRRGGFEIRDLALTDQGLLNLSGTARVQHSAGWQISEADLTLTGLQFPAAYVSFLQLPLASTDFAELNTAGTASGHLIWRGGTPQRLDLSLDGLTFDDPKRKLRLAGLAGAVHWAARQADAAPSQLVWRELQAYGLEGGAAQLDFRAAGRGFALLAPARLPLFDGGLAVQRCEARALGEERMQLDFDAAIEPISMGALSRAFGWPEMAGTLAGRIPGLAYRNGELRVDGEIDAQVFDGTVSVQRLRLHDPLGKWPQLFADFRARNIDLERITRTFPIGSITGRLDADVTGLELFDWSPVAFDGRLYTTPGDRSRHRISQKAVSSLSNLGGGGGGVAAALQTGFLKFFQTFGYDRIGLSCQLRNDVCLMDGIHRLNGGFYIVKGGGLPRIDIIGNSGRVAWGQLLGQIESAIESGDIQVK